VFFSSAPSLTRTFARSSTSAWRKLRNVWPTGRSNSTSTKTPRTSSNPLGTRHSTALVRSTARFRASFSILCRCSCSRTVSSRMRRRRCDSMGNGTGWRSFPIMSLVWRMESGWMSTAGMWLTTLRWRRSTKWCKMIGLRSPPRRGLLLEHCNSVI